MGRTTKMSIKYAVVDAFTDSEFKGNPAAVCLLEDERDEEWLKSLASEFNQPVTCFLTRITDSDSPKTRFQLWWFSPIIEVKICGHATLAAAHFCFTSGLVNNGHIIEFSTLSGILTAQKMPEPKTPGLSKCDNSEAEQSILIELDFPTIPVTDYNENEASSISKVLGGISVIDVKRTGLDDLLAVLPSAKAVIDVQPQFEEIKKFPCRGLILSALEPSESGFDFVSRFFYPKLGVNEDSVCGSAHCALAVYWHKKLGKCDFRAYAASPRSGDLNVHLDEHNDRVKLQGKVVTVMEGSIKV